MRGVHFWARAEAGERAAESLRLALEWIDAASRGLSDELRSSFADRNPVNRRLIELGRRLFAPSA